MEGVGLEKGLIRFVSEDGIKTGEKFKWTKRTVGYSSVLLLITVVLAFLIATRNDFETTILRTRGTIYQKFDEGHYSNIYDVNLINKTNQSYNVDLKLIDVEGEIKIVGKELELNAQKETKGKFLVILNRAIVSKDKNVIYIGIYRNGELKEKVKTIFLGPIL